MENNKKISFLSRMIFAVTDFRIYPFIAKEKVISAISYFLKLLFLVTLIISICVFSKIYGVVEKFSEDYNVIMPNFVLENGVLNAEKRIEYGIENGIMIIDTNYTTEELKNMSSKKIIGYNYNLLVSKEGAYVYIDDALVDGMNFSQISGKHTKETFYKNILAPFNELSYRICFFIVLYIIIILLYVLLKMISVLAAMLLVMILNILFGNKLKFSDEFKIVAYVLTLPVILETAAFVIIGAVSESVILIYQLLVGVYVFYALRAIKLDKIIIAATQGGMLKKIIDNGVPNAEEESKSDGNENNIDVDKENKED